MKSPSDIVGATCFVFQPPGIESCNGAVNPKWEFHMRHGDNPAFRWAHLLMPGAVRTGRTVEAIPTEQDALDSEIFESRTGGRFCKCQLEAGGEVFTTFLWARSQMELKAMCRHIGLLVPANLGQYEHFNDISRWQRIKCVLRYFWLRRPTIKLRSPVTP